MRMKNELNLIIQNFRKEINEKNNFFNEMAEIHEERKNKDIQEEGLQEMTEDQKKNKEKISQMIAEMLDTGKQFD